MVERPKLSTIAKQKLSNSVYQWQVEDTVATFTFVIEDCHYTCFILNDGEWYFGITFGYPEEDRGEGFLDNWMDFPKRFKDDVHCIDSAHTFLETCFDID